MSDPAHNAAAEKVQAVEETISNLLRVGVSISATIIVVGMTLIMIRTGGTLRERIAADAAFPHTPAQVWAGLTRGDGQSVVVLGLAVLLATPFLRVAVSAVAFVRAKDWAFVWITLIVLTLLATSLFIGVGHG